MNHNTKKQAREYDSPLIQSLLAEITPEEHERTVKQMMMSARIEDGIIAKGWNKGDFAKKMGKNPSEVSKWLSGSHNFTLDTLTDIQRVLGIQLLCVEEEKPIIQEVVKVEYRTILVSSKVSGSERPYQRKEPSNSWQQLALA
jgi:transcriptional regulator with XRE-family HTH domain